MFSKIRDGTFDPDGTRVRRLFQLAFDTALEMEDDTAESPSDSEDVSSVASSGGEHRSLDQKSTYRRLEADNMEADLCLINHNSKVIHLLVCEDEKFWCGRNPSSSSKKAAKEDLSTPEAVVCASCSHAYRAAQRDSRADT